MPNKKEPENREAESIESKEVGLEELFSDIEAIIRNMEDKDVSLEQSFFLYEQGMNKLKQCSDKINRVEKKMLMFRESGELAEFERE